MTEQGIIETYFNKVGEAEQEDDEKTSTKRPRSSGNSVGDSPSSKRVVLDDEDVLVSIPDDAPFGVPLMFKALDRVNAQVIDASDKVDKFMERIEEKIVEIEKETVKKVDKLAESVKEIIKGQDSKINELTDSVKFLAGAYESQKSVVQSLLQKVKSLEDHHDTIKSKWTLLLAKPMKLMHSVSTLDAIVL